MWRTELGTFHMFPVLQFFYTASLWLKMLRKQNMIYDIWNLLSVMPHGHQIRILQQFWFNEWKHWSNEVIFDP